MSQGHSSQWRGMNKSAFERALSKLYSVKKHICKHKIIFLKFARFQKLLLHSFKVILRLMLILFISFSVI